MRRAVASVALLSIGMLLLASCGMPPLLGDSRPDAMVVGADALCDAEVPSGGLPDDFEPVAVYVCDHGYEIDPPVTLDGEQAPLELPPPERREGDLAPLLSAFGVPDDPRWPGPCPAIGWAGPSVWAVDAADRLVRLQYPLDGCRMPKDVGIFGALDEIAPVD